MKTAKKPNGFKLQTLAGTYYPQQPKPPKKAVDLIASGYEWICPKCQFYNWSTGLVTEVECTGCERKFTVRDFHHATN